MMEQIEVPDDFDKMDSMAIETLFDLAVEQVTPIPLYMTKIILRIFCVVFLDVKTRR